MRLLHTKAGKARRCCSGPQSGGVEGNARSWYQGCDHLNYAQPSVSKYHKWMCDQRAHPSSNTGSNGYLCSCRAVEGTIAHICMLKLIGRDAGDKEGEQRQHFVTIFHLTGIIRYMKLKFHTGGPVDNTTFCFVLLPLFLLCSCLC